MLYVEISMLVFIIELLSLNTRITPLEVLYIGKSSHRAVVNILLQIITPFLPTLLHGSKIAPKGIKQEYSENVFLRNNGGIN